MLGEVFFGLLLGVQSVSGADKSFVPASDAIDVAERVARGEGYSLADRTKFSSILCRTRAGSRCFLAM